MSEAPAEVPERDPRDGRTPEDIKNGWSFEDWHEYHKSRSEAAGEKIDIHRPSRRGRPTQANGHQWGFPVGRSWIKTPSWQR